MTTPASVAILTKKDCDDFYKNREPDGSYKNPITGRKIIENGPAFKVIKKHCDEIANDNTSVPSNTKAATGAKTKSKELNTEELVELWLKNPQVNPKNDKKILISFKSNSEYFILYNIAYDYLKDVKNLTNDQLKHNLPFNHLLFSNQLDLLYYLRNKNEYSDDERKLNEYIYEKIQEYETKSLRDLEYPSNLHIGGINSVNEKKIYYIMIKLCASIIGIYYRMINIILYEPSIDYNDEYINRIVTTMNQIKMISFFTSKYGLNSIFKGEFYIGKLGGDLTIKELKIESDYFFTIYNIIPKFKFDYNYIVFYLLRSQDPITKKLFIYFEELYNIFNNKYEPEESPFVNIENKQFRKIEDPLITLMNKFLTTGSFNNIDINMLDLPKRPFKDDKEFETVKSQYESLKNKYEKEVNEWRTKYDKIKTETKKSPSNLTPPKRPTFALPYGKTIMIGQNLPYYMPDEKYNAIKKIHDENKSVIKLYKELVNVGLLDIMKKINSSYSPSYKYELLDKDREYFEENILDDSMNNRMKCNSNTDALSQEEFDNQNYLLAKLQLMYKLHTRNDNNEIIRTDCFYAPNMYNYIVSKINEKESIVNPVTKQPISDEDISELMKIMNIIDPSLEKPYFIKPIHDKFLKLTHDEIYHNNKTYYCVSITRKIGPFDLYIKKNLCYIPADIDQTETGSTDIASTVCLFSIYKLFNDGKLLETYIPPYNVNGRIIKPFIHFNNMTLNNWNKPRDEQIRLLTHYLQEIRRYL